MPEGPELKISCELIRPLVKSKYITGVGFFKTGRYGEKSPEGYYTFCTTDNNTATTIEDVNVKGKFMYWTFSNDWYMFCTYGMTGQWSPKEGKHACGYLLCSEESPCLVNKLITIGESGLLKNKISLTADPDDTHLYFNDPRHFGTIKFVKGKDKLTAKLNTLGWDPFSGLSDQDFKFVQLSIFDSKKPLAQLLMDQSIFAGVGNYIKSEALYLAKLSPHRQGNSLSDAEIYELCRRIKEVMDTSYEHQGATISTYSTPYGDEGKYSTLFKVYGQKKDPLGNKIIKETLADKRTTHWVPTVQG